MGFDSDRRGCRRFAVAAAWSLVAGVVLMVHALAAQEPPRPIPRPERRGIAVDGPPVEAGGGGERRDQEGKTEKLIPPALAVEDQGKPPRSGDAGKDAEQGKSPDLEVQQSMARSAEAMIPLTKAQIVLGVIGTLFGLAALIYTARSTRIAAETHRIALAELSRPYVIFEGVSHNLEEWRSGNQQLRFLFRLTNHGTAPALVKTVLAYATVSFGPGSHPEDEPTHRSFPEKEGYLRRICPPWGIVRMRSDETTAKTEDFDTAIIRPGEKTRIFESLVPYPVLEIHDSFASTDTMRELHKLTGEGRVHPWLFAHAYYQSLFGAGYITNYCAFGLSDSSVVEYGEEPYTQRT